MEQDRRAQTAQDDVAARVSHHDRDSYLGVVAEALAEIGTQAIKADQKTMTEFDLLIPGRFQTMSQGERVTYVRDIADSNELSDVFITELEHEEGDELGTTVIMVADEGETRIDEQGNRLLVLRSGKRYRMKPGALGHQVIEFETYGQVLADIPQS